jgi:hypothetical protein
VEVSVIVAFVSALTASRIAADTAGMSMEPFHIGCPYTSLAICYCSLFVSPQPTYVATAAAALPDTGCDSSADLQRELLYGIMHAASSRPAAPSPSPHAMLAAAAAARAPPPPPEALAATLAAGSAGMARTTQRVHAEWRQAQQAELQAKTRRVRGAKPAVKKSAA